MPKTGILKVISWTGLFTIPAAALAGCQFVQMSTMTSSALQAFPRHDTAYHARDHSGDDQSSGNIARTIYAGLQSAGVQECQGFKGASEPQTSVTAKCSGPHQDLVFLMAAVKLHDLGVCCKRSCTRCAATLEPSPRCSLSVYKNTQRRAHPARPSPFCILDSSTWKIQRPCCLQRGPSLYQRET